MVIKSTARKLFVICTLERREPLDEEGVVQLFQSLSLRTSNFELVAVKLVAPAPPDACCGPSLLRQMVGNGGACTLRIHELQCRQGVGHAGLTLLDPTDNADLSDVLFDGGVPDKRHVVPDPLGKPARVGAVGGQTAQTVQTQQTVQAPGAE